MPSFLPRLVYCRRDGYEDLLQTVTIPYNASYNASYDTQQGSVIACAAALMTNDPDVDFMNLERNSVHTTGQRREEKRDEDALYDTI